MRYIYRPNDYAVFVEARDNQFTLKATVDKGWAITESNSYTYEELVGNYGFIECTVDELPKLKKQEDLEFEFTTWQSRPDGHGGAKGGTREEFMASKK